MKSIGIRDTNAAGEAMLQDDFDSVELGFVVSLDTLRRVLKTLTDLPF
jgi:hypothetical protein